MPSSPSAPTDLWLRGVAVNTGAPADVLLRLLDPAAGEGRRILCEERRLPDEVVDAVVAHPDPKVRRAFAGNPHVPPATAAVWSTTPTTWFARPSPGDPTRARAGRSPCPTTSSSPC
ncbi:hypothetical protein Slala04_41730 [Streptomyces lavendulae subsp. lavendulae]|nr:hypothetical protein Slala04_41730 [Streptomyces lavendulae subsp. lavendulae]